MQSSIDHRILQLLEEQREPLTASYIGFVLNECPFEMVANSLYTLWQSGRITLGAYGYSRTLASAENKPELACQYIDGDMRGTELLRQEQQRQHAPDYEALGVKKTRMGDAPNLAPRELFSMSAFSAATCPPAPADEGDALMTTMNTPRDDLAEDSRHNLDEPPQTTPNEGVVAIPTHDGCDESSETFGGDPSLGAPRESFLDDTEPLYAELSDASLPGGLDQCPDEGSIGLSQEVMDTVSYEYLKMLEDYLSSKHDDTKLDFVQPRRTSQEQDEYQALFDPVFAKSSDDDSKDAIDEFSMKHAQKASGNEECPRGLCFTCWTSVSVLELPSRASNALSRNSISNVRDLIKAFDSLRSEKGLGTLSLMQISNELLRHSSDMPVAMDADQIHSLCSISGSVEYAFDVFGYLCHVDSGDRIADEANKSVTSLPKSLGLSEATASTAPFDGLKDDQTPITDLGLPNRLTKTLTREGYSTVGAVAGLSDDAIFSFRGVGKLSVEQLHHALENYAKNNLIVFSSSPMSAAVDVVEEPPLSNEAPERNNELATNKKAILSATHGAELALEQCKTCRYPIFDDSFLALEPLVAVKGLGEGYTPEDYRDYILDSLEGTDDLIEACAASLTEKVEQARVFDLTTDFPHDINVPDIPEWDAAARKVANTKAWCSYDSDQHTIAIHHPNLLDWLESSGTDDRTYTMLRMYLSGKTLEACGQEVGLTRERVRQIVSKKLQEVPFIEENRYRHFYEAYGPTKADFLSITGEPVSTYLYLRATERSKAEKRLPYGNVLNDKRVPRHVRDNVRKILDKGFIYSDGFRIQAKRDAIINHIAMRHASTRLIKVSTFRALYDQFLVDNGLSAIKGFRFNTMHSFEAYVDRCEQILKLPHSAEGTYGGSVRYYDAANMDFGPLVKLISSGILGDIECSAAALMVHEDFYEIIEELDIHNGHELHYVLSRYCHAVNGMKVGRSPNVTFGKGNRDDQILEMIKELSPISAQDLAESYSKRYGVDPGTFMGSYLGAFKIYLRHGKYVYNDQGLNKEQAAFIKKQLEGSGRDYLSVSLLKARFKNRFPHASTSLINGGNIVQFGYHPSAGLLVRDSTDERAMFASLLDSKRRFAVSDDDFGKDVFDNPAFQAELAIRERAFKLVEFEKDSYLACSIFSDENVGLDETDLRDYVDCAIEFMKPDMPYTVKSLKASGFSHRIDVLRDDFGLEDFFFVSLLGTGSVGGRIKRTSVGDTPVFCKTFYAYSAPIMFEQIIAKEEAIEIDDLAYLLEDTYGIHANNALLRTIVKRSDLYFIETIDMVFDSEETYRRKAREWIS